MSRILVVDDSTTVRRVVERVLREAGYEVTVAGDPREGLERAQRWVPDLVLLDYAMPHMDGVQFCKSMRAIANLREVPVVLMSAIADRIGDGFVAQTGAIDALGKPFAPDTLLAVTAHALARAEARARTSVPGTTTSPGAEPSEGADATEPGIRVDVVDRVVHAIAAVVAPALRRLVADPPSADTLATEIAGELDVEKLVELGSLARAAAGDYEPGSASFEGRIEDVPVGEVLQLLQHQRQTGLLEVRRGERAVTVCVRQGLVDIAIAMHKTRDDEFLLGRYLLEEELIDREELDALLRQRGDRRLLGTRVVKLGYVSSEDLQRVLVRQTSELIYETLRWRTGRYAFRRFAPPPEPADARLGLPVSSILMEGLRRVDEWRLIEEQLSGFDQVLVPNRDAIATTDLERFSREEMLVLEAVDGARTLRQVIDATHMASFDACKILFRLVTAGLVKARDPRD